MTTVSTLISHHSDLIFSPATVRVVGNPRCPGDQQPISLPRHVELWHKHTISDWLYMAVLLVHMGLPTISVWKSVSVTIQLLRSWKMWLSVRALFDMLHTVAQQYTNTGRCLVFGFQLTCIPQFEDQFLISCNQLSGNLFFSLSNYLGHVVHGNCGNL